LKHNVFSWLSNAEKAVTVGLSSLSIASGQSTYELDRELILHVRYLKTRCLFCRHYCHVANGNHTLHV